MASSSRPQRPIRASARRSAPCGGCGASGSPRRTWGGGNPHTRHARQERRRHGGRSVRAASRARRVKTLPAESSRRRRPGRPPQRAPPPLAPASFSPCARLPHSQPHSLVRLPLGAVAEHALVLARVDVQLRPPRGRPSAPPVSVVAGGPLSARERERQMDLLPRASHDIVLRDRVLSPKAVCRIDRSVGPRSFRPPALSGDGWTYPPAHHMITCCETACSLRRPFPSTARLLPWDGHDCAAQQHCGEVQCGTTARRAPSIAPGRRTAARRARSSARPSRRRSRPASRPW